MVRYATTETEKIVFAGLCDESPSAGAVHVYIYQVNPVDGSLVPTFGTGTCRQAGSSDLYGYSIAEYNLVYPSNPFPTDEAEYVWYMENTDTGTQFASGYFIVGGYPDNITDYSSEFTEITSLLQAILGRVNSLGTGGGASTTYVYPGSSPAQTAAAEDYTDKFKKLERRIDEVRDIATKLGEHLKKGVV